ncbi:hypothetical protein [Agilicoccus flavus]|uniref:hypothetical protein n=1 Tax=Agilicoccus flavus TaxID=2775968 RepID=UPI001CF625BC|nr:hypothetical protein [Agilicoccus flavus]
MSLAPTYWSGRFARWPAAEPAVPGYSLLMPVPGDLPVFLELAMATCATQESAHRVETIVVPDRPTKAIAQVLESRRSRWNGPISMRYFPHPERHLLPALRNPFHNYGIQLITGVSAARGTHVILHDADLFLLRPGALDDRYTRTRDEGLFVSGVNSVWDEWYASKDLTIAATWELCASRDWLRSFPPHMHMGHESELFGEQHVFDITLHTQALSDQRRIAIHEQDDAIVHFNYVIATYRHFQKSTSTFADDRFRLLLVRMFVDLFAQEPYDYKMPTMSDLADGLTNPEARVVYPSPTEATSAEYRDFRGKIERILTGAWVPPGRADAVATAMAAFDAHYS